jgi:hypothetical protein
MHSGKPISGRTDGEHQRSIFQPFGSHRERERVKVVHFNMNLIHTEGKYGENVQD